MATLTPQQIYAKIYYLNNLERLKQYDRKRRQLPEVKARKREKDRQSRERLRAIVDEIKISRGCVDCGYNVDARALEFDHVRGIKIAAVSTMVTYRKNLKTILEEIEKCEVRCANCHKIKTWR